jgi:CTP synthase (UTP-ammonia lyase)
MPNDCAIGLIGDFNPEVVAHRAIENCFRLVGESGNSSLKGVWIGTKDIRPGDDQQFEPFQGLWCVPASPYQNLDGALWAIGYARTRRVPFLGTCGGFQHALLEYARNVLQLQGAEHAEVNQNSAFPLLSKLRCSLVEQRNPIRVNSKVFEPIYGGESGLEEFNCSYGLNRDFEHLFENGALQIVARSEDGEARAFMLKDHPFFVGTLFQPERAALKGSLHPVVKAFFRAVCSTNQKSKGDLSAKPLIS